MEAHGTDWMQDTIDHGFEVTAKAEAVADEKEAEGEFRQTALDRMHEDWGLDGEMLTHCAGAMFRLSAWVIANTVELQSAHPYSKPGGEQLRADDLTTIRDQQNGWLEDQEKAARQEFITQEQAA